MKVKEVDAFTRGNLYMLKPCMRGHTGMHIHEEPYFFVCYSLHDSGCCRYGGRSGECYYSIDVDWVYEVDIKLKSFKLREDHPFWRKSYDEI